MRLLSSYLLLLLATASPSLAATDPSAKPPPKPCTLKSPLTGAYFDLNKISIIPPPDSKDDGSSSPDTNGGLNGGGGTSTGAGEVRSESWHARGYDYGANFTLNICAPVVEKLDKVEGIEDDRKANISGFYMKDDKVFSIGQASSEPIFRGKRMVLNYTDGSPCPAPSQSSRKSTIISFLCDRDMVGPPATLSYVGTLDECSYFFEIRTSAACGGVAASSEGGLSPAGVFGVIALIAIAVYLAGGCAYQRTVMHQRGWRQLPNYSLWASIAGAIKDILSSCLTSLISLCHLDRCFSHLRSSSSSPNNSTGGGYGGFGRRNARNGGGRGYSRVNDRGSGGTWSERLDVDEENRIIDQLDEEWED